MIVYLIFKVGCLVSVDARRVHISGVKNVEYQVIAAAHIFLSLMIIMSPFSTKLTVFKSILPC